jgi:hypothetical protein
VTWLAIHPKCRGGGEKHVTWGPFIQKCRGKACDSRPSSKVLGRGEGHVTWASKECLVVRDEEHMRGRNI